MEYKKTTIRQWISKASPNTTATQKDAVDIKAIIKRNAKLEQENEI
ncbi:hypothetical protein [Clostridium taeniosporum]|nr:hypothetical protein [Clostridium taeniosporum]